jgi:hypothetical protein
MRNFVICIFRYDCDQNKVDEMNVSCMGVKRNVYQNLIRKPDGRRPFGRLRHWEVNMKADLNIYSAEVIDAI